VLALLASVLPSCARDRVLPYVDDTLLDAEPAPDLGLVMDPLSSDGAVVELDAGSTGVATSSACDLNGRWLVAQRTVATAIGQQQAAHNWFYYELRQDGDQVTVTKGLHCGYEVVALTFLAVNVDSHTSWPAFLSKNSSSGRRGSFSSSGGSCSFALDKEYVARALTLPYYLDPSKPLPNKGDPGASGSTPGWEDWDGDGKPGITLDISGGASGQLAVVQRDWTSYAGTVPAGAKVWKAAVTWGSEQHALWSTSSLLEASSSPDSDATLHYVYFAKLDPDQATGDDAAKCAAVRALYKTLTPEANR
jgi:hypothetical protein